MALLASGRHKLCRLLHSPIVRPGLLHNGQRSFSADPAPSESNDNVTIRINPFKGHKLEPPSRDVETNKEELLDMFEVYMLSLTLDTLDDHTSPEVHTSCRPWCA